MPFVNIRILKGHSQQRKDEIARRVTESVSEFAELPKRLFGLWSRMWRQRIGMFRELPLLNPAAKARADGFEQRVVWQCPGRRDTGS
jgi:hypothetical protein